MVITPTSKQSKHGSYAGLETHHSEYNVIVGVGAVKSCNDGGYCSGFPGMIGAYRFTTMSRIYCMVTLQGHISGFTNQMRADFIVAVAELLNVLTSQIKIEGVLTFNPNSSSSP